LLSSCELQGVLLEHEQVSLHVSWRLLQAVLVLRGRCALYRLWGVHDFVEFVLERLVLLLHLVGRCVLLLSCKL